MQAQQAFQAQHSYGQQAAARAEAVHCGFGCMVSQPWEEEGAAACSPTASEDSATSACSPLDFSFSSATNEASPFADARENSRSRRPGSNGAAGFSLPGLRLPNLRAIKTSAAGSLVKAAAPAARAPVPKALTVPSARLSTKLSSGRPPLGAGSLRFRSGSLQKGGSYQANASVELVAAWGQIRGQVCGERLSANCMPHTFVCPALSHLSMRAWALASFCTLNVAPPHAVILTVYELVSAELDGFRSHAASAGRPVLRRGAAGV